MAQQVLTEGLEPRPSEFSAIEREIISLIRARYPLIYLVSFEEKRIEEKLQNIARHRNKTLWIWSFTQGFVDVATGKQQEGTAEPLDALNKVLETPPNGAFLYVLKDFHVFMSPSAGERSAACIRKLRDALHHITSTQSTLMILSPVLQIAPELEKEVTVLDFPLPTKEDMYELLARFEREQGKRATIKPDAATRESVVQALLGLTQLEAENVLSRALVNDGRLDARDVPLIIQEKQQIIRKSGVLEFHPLRESVEHVGGLGLLKKWLERKRYCMTEAAAARGIAPPRGILLIGVPGCGKSLMAKAVANMWKVPLLRFDLGKVFGMYVGMSEENIRRAIQMAESIAPCVLWIDEMEKGFAGVSGSSSTDSGVTARVFGSFITWLQEKDKPAFVVATANDISSLPAELLRKGRFDEIFFVDLPTEEERVDIFAKLLLKRHRPECDPGLFDLRQLARATPGFTGADIEQIISESLEKAFAENGRNPTTQDFLSIAEGTLPLSATMRSQIEALRSWARTRARRASEPVEDVGVPSEEDFANRGRRLEL